MSFAPVIPIGGYGGWKFLNRTMDSQKAAVAASPANKRDEAYFREKIGSIKTAEALVSDRRLLAVALGAFGLGEDINNRFFIRKVLEDGTLSNSALSNRLADKRYQALSAAFGFGNFGVPRTQLSDFANKIIVSFRTQQFEQAVGQQNDDMRLALNARRELAGLATRAASDTTQWLTILGSAPLRQVFQTAFGLGSGFGAIDLDQQVSTLRNKAEQVFGAGTVAQFADPDRVENLLRRFFVRSDSATAFTSSAPGASALQLLQAGSQSGASSLLSLLR